MVNIGLDYNTLLSEYKNYKATAEKTIDGLKVENNRLGKSLAVLFNIVEISGYLNSFLSKDNLVVLINDMIIGVIGATNSTIYLVENDKFVVKATNHSADCDLHIDKCKEYMDVGQACIINCKEKESSITNVKSILGIPILIGDKLIGYIVAEHTVEDFFNDDHKLFLGAIASQIAIAIENARLYKELQRIAEVDPLLNIYNRRTFFNKVEKRLKKKIANFAIVMIDLDNFKRINDTLGHQMGDEVLIQTTKVINRNINKSDIFARYGGEELIIFIRDYTSKDFVHNKVERIRRAIENNIITFEDQTTRITASIGLSFNSNERDTLSSNIKLADTLLYESKKNGKNKITSSECKL